tara:strand:+ start:628 stop:1110 length:483 start_codon:yes stop_codon:yes gene_type:complete
MEEEEQSCSMDSIIVTESNYSEFADKYNSMFAALCLINENNPCKLGVHENRLYKCWNTLGSVQRTYYGESRETLINYLEENFQKYVQFYNNMFSLLRKKNNGLIHEIATIIDVSRLNIGNWINGLRGVAATYPHDKTIKSKITIIISMLTGILSKKVIRG